MRKFLIGLLAFALLANLLFIILNVLIYGTDTRFIGFIYSAAVGFIALSLFILIAYFYFKKLKL